MSTEELVQHLLHDPSIAGITPDIAKAVAISQMKFCQAKSIAVVAGPTDAGLPTGEAAEVHQQQEVQEEAPRQDEGDEDPWSDDEEEYERLVANSKEGETVEKVKVRKAQTSQRRTR